MKNVSIREYLDQRFHDHQKHVDQRFDKLEAEIVANRTHGHGSYVTWTVFVTVVVSLTSLVIWLA